MPGYLISVMAQASRVSHRGIEYRLGVYTDPHIFGKIMIKVESSNVS
jgi:hypothetical protein